MSGSSKEDRGKPRIDKDHFGTLFSSWPRSISIRLVSMISMSLSIKSKNISLSLQPVFFYIMSRPEGRRRSSVADIVRSNDGVMRVNDDVVRRLSVARPDLFGEQQAAGIANDAEKGLTVRQSMKLYKKGIFFSLMMSLAVVMEGSV